MDKTINQKAWFLVLPVFAVVAFSAILPLMTVVNYSMQDTFGNNQFFWNGVGWFSDVLESDRFWQALGRNLLFSGIILSIEIPLGILIALNMPSVSATPGDSVRSVTINFQAAEPSALPDNPAAKSNVTTEANMRNLAFRFSMS